MGEKDTVQIFYATDDKFTKYVYVSIFSLKENADKTRFYHIHILNSGLNKDAIKMFLPLEDEHFTISFDDVTMYMADIKDQLPLRDYYAMPTYYRLCIVKMFPDLDKVLYIDGDTIVRGNIGELFDTDIKDNYIGAAPEAASNCNPLIGDYTEKCLGVGREMYFNAGVLIISLNKFREHAVLEKFIKMVGTYTFIVAQDQDYLNVICKDHVYYFSSLWNAEVFFPTPYKEEDYKIIHYIFAAKPWHYSDCPCNEYFWKYAKNTALYKALLNDLHHFTDDDKVRDMAANAHLIEICISEASRPDNYLNRLNKGTRDYSRVQIMEKIKQYEEEGRFAEDAENDPPSRVLMPDEVDYINHGIISSAKTFFAFKAAKLYLRRIISTKRMIIKAIEGEENIKNINSGAIITCNHFNPLDSFAIQLVYQAAKKRNRKFYRVIKEGNYTSFPGFYGFLMRHCNTLPLSSNLRTMKKFINSTDTLLKQGHFVLFYPEQSLWWNYRKPKPLKRGAFDFAAKDGVPVLPVFITMKDSDYIGQDGFPVQEYTIHIGKPIYPDKTLSPVECAEKMQRENSEYWKEVYEKAYQRPLTYITKPDEKDIIIPNA